MGAAVWAAVWAAEDGHPGQARPTRAGRARGRVGGRASQGPQHDGSGCAGERGRPWSVCEDRRTRVADGERSDCHVETGRLPQQHHGPAGSRSPPLPPLLEGRGVRGGEGRSLWSPAPRPPPRPCSARSGRRRGGGGSGRCSACIHRRTGLLCGVGDLILQIVPRARRAILNGRLFGTRV